VSGGNNKLLIKRVADLIDRGDLPAARKLLSSVLEADYGNKEALLLAARTYIQSGNHRKAADVLRRVLEIEPDSRDAIIGLARSLSATGEFAETEELMRAVISRHPDTAIYRNIMAGVLVNKGEHWLALEQVNKAMVAEPDNPYFIFSAAEIHARRGDVDKAFDLLQPYLESEKPPNRAVVIFAQICEFLGMADEGILLLEKALADPLMPAQARELQNLHGWLLGNRP